MKLELTPEKPLTVDRLDDFILDIYDAEVPCSTPITVNMDGYEFSVECIELDTDGVIRIHLRTQED